MPKSAGRKKKQSKSVKEYESEWTSELRDTLLPRLRRAMHESSLSHLSTQVDVLRHHLTSFYDALDLAVDSSAAAVAGILHPGEWRTPLQSPFLCWLGDIHPYLLTNLLRSFLDSDDDGSDDENDESALQARLRTRFALLQESNELLSRPWHIVTAWKKPSASLTARVEQIECGVRLMAPALAARARAAQAAFVAAVARDWSEAAIGEAAAAQMEEMAGVVVDANRLRRSVLTEMVGATTVYQSALFLEALSQFLVGFRDPQIVSHFDSCKTPLRAITLPPL